MDTKRCCTDVYGEWSSHQCQRKWKVKVGGKRYCNQHNPTAVKAREDERSKVYHKETDTRRRQWLCTEELAGIEFEPGVIREVIEALGFYADPDTYFAVAFLSDPPCGDFMTDISSVDGKVEPGNRARRALAKITVSQEP